MATLRGWFSAGGLLGELLGKMTAINILLAAYLITVPCGSVVHALAPVSSTWNFSAEDDGPLISGDAEAGLLPISSP